MAEEQNIQETPSNGRFSAKDFSTADDIINIIDTKNAESTEETTPESAPDEAKSEETNPEVKAEPTQTADDQGTPKEQSEKDPLQVSEEPSSEEKIDVKSEEQSEDKPDTKEEESDKSLELSDIDVGDDEELVLETDGGEVIPVAEILEDYASLMEKYENDENWQKSNTEKAQENAEEKRQFSEFINQFGTEEIKEALQNEDLMEALDDWFDDKASNPFRKLNDDAIEKYNQSELDGMGVTIDRELFELEKIDDSIDDDVKNDLVNYALENEVTLTQAYDLISLDWFQDRVQSLENELHQRNGELSEAKEKPAPAKKVPAPVSGTGTKQEKHDGPAGSWKDAEDRVLKSLGL